MTEIKIEKKKPVWPWILLALGIVLLLLLAFCDRDEEVVVPTVQQPVETTTEAPATASLLNVKENDGTVAEFVTFVESTRTMGLDHNYTNQTLLKLAAAIEAMAKAIDFDVKADIDKIKEYAGQITEAKFKESHANSIRSAADIAAGALQRMQQAKYPELEQEAAQVKTAAEAINPDVLTLSQKDAVKGFFDQSASLLSKMN